MKLVAHTKMMMELTVYLAKKILCVIPANLCFVSAFENQRTGTLRQRARADRHKDAVAGFRCYKLRDNKHSYVLSRCWCVRACTEALS